MSGSGPHPDRVALLSVKHSGGQRRGTGYRINDTTVLTAAHVIADASAVRAVFDVDLPDEWSIPATVTLTLFDADLALLNIVVPEERHGLEPVKFGQVGRAAAVLQCTTVGFPRFKIRSDASPGTVDCAEIYRDVHQADGTISSLSNWREGTLELTVNAPGDDTTADRSPWEGMSGAAVWCAGHVIGVVSRHHRNDGLNRLAATPITRCYGSREINAENHDKLHAFRILAGLPDRRGQLSDVIPSNPETNLLSAYTEQIVDIAPITLLGRDNELAELTRFCAEDQPYAWWQAGPWAGKTALASWFVLHPPVGVIVVAFFVTRRLAGQADSNAFTEALIDQLAALVGEPAPPATSAASRDGQRRRLLKKAAEQVTARGQRLVLLVDGLDEDEGVPPASPSSITALLPRHPLGGLRVLVTSRPHPGLPHDVAPDHPLRGLTARKLEPSQLGEQLKFLARTELVEHLHGHDSLAKNVIGFITAAGGGLTAREIGELAETGYVDLRARLGSVFGRSMRTRVPVNLHSERAEPVYLFAHETLRELAELELGYDLAHYRDRIYTWAGSYQRRGWPEDTPRYLGRPYSRLLTGLRDADSLTRLITDPNRHDRMLAASATDAAAFAEIVDAQQLLLGLPEMELTSLAVIAVEQHRLAQRNKSLPTDLPAVWIMLGQIERAHQLIQSVISHPVDHRLALEGAAVALVDAGEFDRAERLARDLTSSNDQAEALALVSGALADAGEFDRAERLARDISSSSGQVEALTLVAGALAGAGELNQARALADIAEDVLRATTSSSEQADGLAYVVVALVDAGEFDRAERLARDLTSSNDQAEALALVSGALADAGEFDRAERLARDLTSSGEQAGALAHVAGTLADAGELDRARAIAGVAEGVARAITSSNRKVGALCDVAAALIKIGELDRALSLVGILSGSRDRQEALKSMAGNLARAGHHDRAEQLARRITSPHEQSWVVMLTAHSLVRAGEIDRAEYLARTVGAPYRRSRVLAGLVGYLAEADELDRADHVARTIIAPDHQAEAFTDLAEALAHAGQIGRATIMASTAEQVARTVVTPEQQARTLISVARTLAKVGQVDLARSMVTTAEYLVGTVTDPSQRASVLIRVVEAHADLVNHDRAQDLAWSIVHPESRDVALDRLVGSLCEAQKFDEAERLALAITDAPRRIWSLVSVVQSLVEAGDLYRARNIAMTGESLLRSLADSNDFDWALEGAVHVLAKACLVDRAEHLARSHDDPSRATVALAALVRALIAGSQFDRARAIAADAEALARTITDPNQRTDSLVVVVGALASVGEYDRAEQLAHTIVGPDQRSDALAYVVEAVANGGEYERAKQLAHTIPRPYVYGRALSSVIDAIAQNGRLDEAETLARSIADADMQADALLSFLSSSAPEGSAVYGFRTRAVIATLLTSSTDWLYVLPFVARVDLSAVIATGSALLNLVPREVTT